MAGKGFLLDTNAYYLLFKSASAVKENLIARVNNGGNSCFFISEITSMEIYSVFGKKKRGISANEQQCARKVTINGNEEQCGQVWKTEEVKGIKTKVYKELLKVVADIEAQRGLIQATVLPVDSNSINYGKEFLTKYAHLFSFGSLCRRRAIINQ